MSNDLDKFLYEGSIITAEKWALELEEKDFKTPVEIVNKHEVYLLKENPDFIPESTITPPFIRGRRICGFPRFKDKLRLRCRLAAGAHTNHPGFGRCKYHQNYEAANLPSHYTLMAMAQKGLALSMSELHALEPALLNTKALSDLDEEIIILRMYLSEIINKEMAFAYVDSVLDIIKTVIAAKQAKSRIELERLTIDVRSLDLFVNGIIDILEKNLGKAEYSTIMHEIVTNLKFPANDALQELINSKEQEFKSKFEIPKNMRTENGY